MTLPCNFVANSIDEHLQCVASLRKMNDDIEDIASLWWDSLKNGGQILFCGNGGSAADCQHLAAELCGRFETERRPLRGIALTVDTSVITAIANDYGFETVFSRQVEALTRPGDCLVCISTSGNSKTIIAAAQSGKKIGAKVIGFTGANGGLLAPICDRTLFAPSSHTARIQEMHILAGHCCCEIIDQRMKDK